MLTRNGVSAWIEVDGKEPEQYGVEEDGYNQVTCWIPAQVGKAFSVVYRDDEPYREHSLSSTVYLDGLDIGGKILHLSTASRTVVHNAQIVSATSSRPFMFSKLELTDDEEYMNQAQARLGEIQIAIYKVQALERRPFQTVAIAPDHVKLDERSKKAVTHCVSFGQEVTTPPQYTRCVRYLDDIPLAMFVFRYRDFALLQANGIIPRPPPVGVKPAIPGEVLDLTTGNDVKRETAGEVIEIIDDTTQNQRQKKTVLTKRSNSSHENKSKPAKRVKREKFVPTGEVIDLT